MRRKLIAAFCVLAIAVIWLATADRSEKSDVIDLRPDDPDVVAQGADIYATTCASCHGVALEGQPDWRSRNAKGRLPAPPHNVEGHTWHHTSAALFALTKYGVADLISDPTYQSDMPAFESQLSDDHIIAVLSYIKSTWPQNIRDSHDELGKQQ